MADDTKKPDAGKPFAEAGAEHVGVLLDGGRIEEGYINQDDKAMIERVMAKALGAFGEALKTDSGQAAAPKGPSLHPRP